MRKLLLLIGCLSLASPAGAWKDSSGNLTTHPGATSVAYNRRIAVVVDGTYFPAVNALRARAVRDGLGNLFEQLVIEGGARVDYYSSAYFTNSARDNANQGDSLWKVLGNTYPVVIFPLASSSLASRFFSAESTNAQIVMCGGGMLGGWRTAGNDAAASDTSSHTGYAIYPQGAQTYGSNADTLYVIDYGVRRGALSTGITRVVRLFHPLVLDSTGGVLHACNVDAYSKAFGSGADSAYAVIPATGDSVAGPHEYLPVAWRVYWSGTKHVDFIATGLVESSVGPCWADVLWSLTSRYVKLNPLRWAYDWDDFTREQSGQLRMPKARVDSILVALAAYSVRPTVHLDPGHATAYLSGGTPPGESEVTSPYGSTLRGLRWWSYHSHDSTTTYPWAELSGNGGTTHRSHRYANSSNPDNLGIVQRLQYSDSVRRAIAPSMVVPPYWCPTYNYALPMDWRSRAAQNIYRIGDGKCPIESLFVALRTGLGYSSFSISVPVQQSTGLAITSYAGNEDTSRVATTMFHYGDENWHLASTNVRSVKRLEQWTGATTGRGTHQLNACLDANMLLGFTNDGERGGATAYLFGESFTSTSLPANRNFTALNRLRAVYGHPQADYVGGGWNEIAVLTRGTFQRLRAMNTLAGHQTWVCVEPWNTGRGKTIQ